MQPRLSIGLPLYNGEKYLAEALDSILAQDFADFELIISDNASTDSSPEICQAYARRDKRITYSRLSENVGAAGNYNRVFHMSKGQLFKWAAHDDRIKPNFLKRCVEAFQSYDAPPVVVYTRTELIDENGLILGPNHPKMQTNSSRPSVRAFQAIQGMGAVADAVFGVFQTGMLEKTRLIGSFFAADRVLLFEAALLGEIIRLDGEPLLQRRVHPGMSTKAHRSHQERLSWYNPKARVVMPPGTRVIAEYLRSVVHMENLGLLDRALSLSSALAGVAVRGTRVPLGRYRRRLFSGARTTTSRLR